MSGKEKTEILSPALRPGADGSGMEPLAADIEVSSAGTDSGFDAAVLGIVVLGIAVSVSH